MTGLILIRAYRHMHFQIVLVQWFAAKRREAWLYLCDRVPLQWLTKMFDADSCFPLIIPSRFLRYGDGRLNASM